MLFSSPLFSCFPATWKVPDETNFHCHFPSLSSFLLHSNPSFPLPSSLIASVPSRSASPSNPTPRTSSPLPPSPLAQTREDPLLAGGGLGAFGGLGGPGGDVPGMDALFQQYTSMLSGGNNSNSGDQAAQMEMMRRLLNTGGSDPEAKYPGITAGAARASASAGGAGPSDEDPMADPPSPEIGGGRQALLPHVDPFGIFGGSGGPGGMGGFPGMDSDGGAGLFPPGFDPSSMFGNAASGGEGPLGGSQQTKSLSAKLFPLVHVISMIALWAFAVFWWEPSIAAKHWGTEVLITKSLGAWKKWGLLKGDMGGLAAGLERQAFEPLVRLFPKNFFCPSANPTSWTITDSDSIFCFRVLRHYLPLQQPIFWAFTTIELILQTTRLMVFKKPLPAPSIINNFLPMLPPNLSRNIITGSRYLSLGMQVWKDGCLLIFLLGMTIVFA